jgi:hypothetical protein
MAAESWWWSVPWSRSWPAPRTAPWSSPQPTGPQYAPQDEARGKGAFTKSVTEGLNGKADYRSDGRITLNMLDLTISERVKALTQGRQTPTTVKPPSVPDFPMAMSN